MIFNSTAFWAFFALVFGLYAMLPHRGQNRLLLAASYFFYGCWDWRFLSLLAFTTTVDYLISHRVARATSEIQRKRWLVASLITNLSVLAFFKYFNFFAESTRALLAALGWDLHPMVLQIVLPVGISFYTFQSLSYTVDVYRGHLRPARSWLEFALYISFFPQLVAGPIERATHLLPQVEQPRRLSWDRAREAAWLILWGLYKKIVIADNLAIIADGVFDGTGDLDIGRVLLGAYAFAFQIYCDFSGYSDIARGLARVMGFDLMLNFNNPYFATNPAMFWRRWHISLSTWLRDYLYIPLGGNRKGSVRTAVNLMIVMLLGGLWHGAAWNFVAWGFYQGLLLVVHRWWAGRHPRRAEGCGIWPVIGMFHLICLGWILFRVPSMERALALLSGLLTSGGAFDAADLSPWIAFILLCLPLWSVQWLQEKTGDALAPLKLSLVPGFILLTIIFVSLLTLGRMDSGAFIYFQF